LANQGGPTPNQQLADAIDALPSGQQLFEQRVRTGDAPGIPIPDPPSTLHPEDQRLMEARLAAHQQGFRPGSGRLQAGGRSLGPDLGFTGAPAPVASPSDSLADQRYRELLAMGTLREQGFTEHPSKPTPGTPGVGMNGKFFELPGHMRSKTTAMDVIRRVQQEHPDQGPPRQTNPWVVNRAQQKDFMRQGISSPLAAMLARTDDGGVQGRFAQAAISPQGVAAIGQSDALAAKNQLAQDEQKFKQGNVRGALLTSYMGANPNATPAHIAMFNKALDQLERNAPAKNGGALSPEAMTGLKGGGNAPKPVPFADDVDNTRRDEALREAWDWHNSEVYGERTVSSFRQKMIDQGYPPDVIDRWITENNIANEERWTRYPILDPRQYHHWGEQIGGAAADSWLGD
jgi:hypothetical protein